MIFLLVIFHFSAWENLFVFFREVFEMQLGDCGVIGHVDVVAQVVMRGNLVESVLLAEGLVGAELFGVEVLLREGFIILGGEVLLETLGVVPVTGL